MSRDRNKTRLYLDAPYKRKEWAKRAGARWDAQVKRWWAPRGTLMVEIIRARIVWDRRLFGRPQPYPGFTSVAEEMSRWADDLDYRAVFEDVRRQQHDITASELDWLNRDARFMPRQGWAELVEDRYYLYVQPVHKDIARRHGARWDAGRKQWYATRDSQIASYHRSKDAGIPFTLFQEDPKVVATIYNMVARGTWTAHFGGGEGAADHMAPAPEAQQAQAS